MKRVAILQSNYIPWRGYFGMINYVDEFVLYDEVQYTKGDWRNRNRIRTPADPIWLTIPVNFKQGDRIDVVEVALRNWERKHLRSFEQNYARAAAFEEIRPKIAALYEEAGACSRLSDINRIFLNGICDLLSIDTKISDSSEYPGEGGRTGRLVSICEMAGASHYISGPSARGYLEAGLFYEAGMGVEFVDYSPLPDYEQCYPGFVGDVSVLDLLANIPTDQLRRSIAIKAEEEK